MISNACRASQYLRIYIYYIYIRIFIVIIPSAYNDECGTVQPNLYMALYARESWAAIRFFL